MNTFNVDVKTPMDTVRSISAWIEMDKLTRLVVAVDAFLLPSCANLEAGFPIMRSKEIKEFELDQMFRSKPLRCLSQQWIF